MQKQRKKQVSIPGGQTPKVKGWSFKASNRKGEVVMTLVFFVAFMAISICLRIFGENMFGAEVIENNFFTVEAVVLALSFFAAVYCLNFVKRSTVQPFVVRVIGDHVDVVENGETTTYPLSELELVELRKRGDSYASLSVNFTGKKYKWQARSGWNVFGGSEPTDIATMEKIHKFLGPRAKNK